MSWGQRSHELFSSVTTALCVPLASGIARVGGVLLLAVCGSCLHDFRGVLRAPVCPVGPCRQVARPVT